MFKFIKKILSAEGSIHYTTSQYYLISDMYKVEDLQKTRRYIKQSKDLTS